MSKLYEVLENASREREKLKTRQTHELVPETNEDQQLVFASLREGQIEKDVIGLYQAINAALPKNDGRIIQFIGARKGEGCSTVVHDLARVAATTFGESVLLLDLDPASGNSISMDTTFQCHFDRMMTWETCLDKGCCRTGHQNLFITPLSPQAASALTSLGSEDMVFWRALREQFSLVLIDAPPATVSQTGFSFLKKIDGVVMVVRAEKTRWPVAFNVKEKIESHGGKIIGAVYNDRRFYIPNWLYKWL